MDTLAGEYSIVQPQNGQRYTTDDMLVAWLAVLTLQQADTPVKRFLDLGCGLCSVPMTVLWNYPALRGIGIEKSADRIRLARHSLAANRLDSRFYLVRGDIRQVQLETRFALITSSPPYYTVREGPVSPDSDRAGVRFELSGGIEDYFAAAARHIEPGGCFVTVYPRALYSRVADAACRHGLSSDRQIEVIPRAGKPPLFTLFCYRRAAAGRAVREKLTIRDDRGAATEAYCRLRARIGFPEPR